uniref:Uncharacterized protein n=1 Tax=Rhizophora mucronata TaxID=61149 RepID=A0A2P2N0N6_RHIMU
MGLGWGEYHKIFHVFCAYIDLPAFVLSAFCAN